LIGRTLSFWRSPNAAAQIQDVETKKRGKRSWIAWVVALLGALAGCILFILTEDWTLPMIWIDQWTIWQLIIFAVILVFFVVGLIKSTQANDSRGDPMWPPV